MEKSNLCWASGAENSKHIVDCRAAAPGEQPAHGGGAQPPAQLFRYAHLPRGARRHLPRRFSNFDRPANAIQCNVTRLQYQQRSCNGYHQLQCFEPDQKQEREMG